MLFHTIPKHIDHSLDVRYIKKAKYLLKKSLMHFIKKGS
jgi:hypothetical protein